MTRHDPGAADDGALADAVRLAFSEHRVASAWNLLASPDHDQRLPALLGLERMLDARGLTLADVATALRHGSDAAGPTVATTRRDREASPSHRTSFAGISVPETVVGRIRTVSRHPAPAGEMLLFTAETESAVYGPIASYAAPQIAHLVEAERSGWILRMLLHRTDSDRLHPRVRRLETI